MSKKKSLAAKIEKQPVSAKGRVELEGKIEKTKTRSARRKSFVMDLRVHSPHSQGYFGVDGIDTAPAIVSLAKVKKLDFIAVTDYHSASFIDELVTAAKGSPVTVFPGVDLRCTLAGCDDVVLTALFPDTVTGKEVGELLDRLGIPSEARGMRKYRVRTPFDEIVKLIEERNGLIIPSRMDQTPYRLSVVPTLVEEYGFRAFDLAHADSAQFFKSRWPKIKFQLYSFSNANSLAQVGSRTARVKMPVGNFESVRELMARE